jgi:hypothetical protein
LPRLWQKPWLLVGHFLKKEGFLFLLFIIHYDEKILQPALAMHTSPTNEL